MAKRLLVEEKPYDPLDPLLAQSVIKGSTVLVEPTKPVEEGTRQRVILERPAGRLPPSQGQLVPMPGNAGAERNAEQGTERRCREKRVMLSRSEERQVERLVDRMADQLQTSLKLSHVLRAAVSVLLHAEEEVIRKLEGIHALDRPSNWDAVALAQFEHELAKAVSHALRDAPPLRDPTPLR